MESENKVEYYSSRHFMTFLNLFSGLQERRGFRCPKVFLHRPSLPKRDTGCDTFGRVSPSMEKAVYLLPVLIDHD